MCVMFFKQKTAYEMRISDWSSDVCSSDLLCIHADIEIVSKSNVCLVNAEIDRPGGYCLNPGKPGFDLDDPVRKDRRRSRVQRLDRAHDPGATCLQDPIDSTEDRCAGNACGSTGSFRCSPSTIQDNLYKPACMPHIVN